MRNDTSQGRDTLYSDDEPRTCTDLPPAPEGWNGDVGFERFESRTDLERTRPRVRMYRLERMEELLDRLGGSDPRIPIVHIAGSKGKGSTSAYTASLLASSGYTVGLYTSPHVCGYRERFTVVPPGYAVGEPVSPTVAAEASRIVEGGARYEDALGKASYRVWRVVEQLIAEGAPEDDLPTTFELLTALAFVFFPAVGCELIVLETGLGGRLDATNVCRPAVCGITRIEREHTEYLGGTIPEIAREKAGIIKEGVPIVCADQRPEALGVIARVAKERRAPIHVIAGSALERTDETPDSDQPPWWNPPIGVDIAGVRSTLRPRMIGSVQGKNIAQAAAIYTTLAASGVVHSASRERLLRALEVCRLPGRGELIGDLFLDGAHTPESVAADVSGYTRRYGVGVRVPVILGIVAGKDIEGIARTLASIAPRVIVSRPGRFKPGDPEDVARRVAAQSTAAQPITVELVPDPSEALAKARTLRPDGAEVPPILVTGSFYMVAEIRRLVLS